MAVKGRTCQVNTVSARIKKREYKEVELRKTRDGRSVKAKFYKCSAFIIEIGNKEIMEVVILIRKEDGTIRYSINNDTGRSLERLSYMQGQSYFIERSFQEAKQQLGINEYQIRAYQCRHGQMIMVSLAMLFFADRKEIIHRQ